MPKSVSQPWGVRGVVLRELERAFDARSLAGRRTVTSNVECLESHPLEQLGLDMAQSVDRLRDGLSHRVDPSAAVETRRQVRVQVLDIAGRRDDGCQLSVVAGG